MEKKLFFVCFFFSFVVTSQTVDVALGTINPFCLAHSGNYLYIAEINNFKISKIDLTSNSTTPIYYNLFFDSPSSFAINGNELYICIRHANKISKIDLNEPNPVLIDVITDINDPISISLNGNNLYIAQRDANKISKINITDSNPIPIDVLTNLNGPRYIVNNGIDMFITENIGQKISKFNMTDSTPVLIEIMNNIMSNGIMLKDNELFLCMGDFLNKVSKINLLDATPTLVDVVSGVNGPTSTIVINNELYIAEFGGNKVTKYALPLKLDEFTLKDKIQVYPNPSSTYFSISNLNQKKYIQLLDLNGRIILKDYIDSSVQINIENLSNGLYNINIEGEKTLKLIKN